LLPLVILAKVSFSASSLLKPVSVSEVDISDVLPAILVVVVKEPTNAPMYLANPGNIVSKVVVATILVSPVFYLCLDQP
jgi:hypothetical protein